jgi:hypothetical protein
MTREQIQRLHFRRDGKVASAQAVCRRLLKLTVREYLDRIRLPVTGGSGPYVYFLGVAGVAVMTKGGAQTRGRSSRRRQIESVATIMHGLEIVDFYIALMEALESGGGRIVAWAGEPEARYQFDAHGRRVLLTPDAYCLWAYGVEEGSFFLEWDRGTESMMRLTQKLERYHAYYRQQAYREHLAESGLRPRVLIVVPDVRREKKVVVWMARRLSKGEFDYLPTVLVGVRAHALHDVLGPIWCKPGESQRVRLVD